MFLYLYYIHIYVCICSLCISTYFPFFPELSPKIRRIPYSSLFLSTSIRLYLFHLSHSLNHIIHTYFSHRLHFFRSLVLNNLSNIIQSRVKFSHDSLRLGFFWPFYSRSSFLDHFRLSIFLSVFVTHISFKGAISPRIKQIYSCLYLCLRLDLQTTNFVKKSQFFDFCKRSISTGSVLKHQL